MGAIKMVPNYSQTFGFAYAGDTLPALMTYAMAASWSESLIAQAHTDPPALLDIAKMIQNLGNLIGKQTEGAET